MKKQLVVAMMGVGLFVSGCQDKGVDVPAQLQSVEESLPIVHKGLVMDLEPYVKGQEVTVKAIIRNEGTDEIPLRYDNKAVLSLEMQAPTGETQTSIVHSDQQSLKPGGAFTLEERFQLPSAEGEYAITAHLNLENTKEFSYEQKQLDALEVLKFEQQQELSFLPNHQMTYVYENKVGDEAKLAEESFVHFQDGFVQSNTPELGTRIYYVDQKGLYLAYKNPEIQKANLIGKVEYDKKQILSFPITVGSTWKTEGIQYEVVSMGESVKAAKKVYHDVVMVEADFGTGVRYYYHEEAGLLQVSVKDGEAWEVTSKLVQRH